MHIPVLCVIKKKKNTKAINKAFQIPKQKTKTKSKVNRFGNNDSYKPNLIPNTTNPENNEPKQEKDPLSEAKKVGKLKRRMKLVVAEKHSRKMKI